ncbi:MAG: hypothetical protein LBT92_02945 [Rickettsiales bacterium]|nr:hypothetical protein [Rickettsiales bacterium]
MKRILFAVFALGLVFAVGAEAARKGGKGNKKLKLSDDAGCEIAFPNSESKIAKCNETCPGLLGKELGKCIWENKIK